MLKKFDFLRKLNKYNMYALIILRLVLGIAFVAHGWQKYSGGVENVVGFFGNVGIPAAGFFAWVVTLVELLGGIALILGILTRYASALIAIVMVVAIWKVKLSRGYLGGFELDLTFLGIALSLMLTGGGPLSVDRAVCGEKA